MSRPQPELPALWENLTTVLRRWPGEPTAPEAEQ